MRPGAWFGRASRGVDRHDLIRSTAWVLEVPEPLVN